MTSLLGLERIVRRLDKHVRLDSDDRAAIHALPLVYRTFDPGAYMVREGEAALACVLLLSGFAYRHKVTGEGQRQIVSVHMPGDLLDLQNSLLGVADHNVQALSRCEVGSVPVAALRALAETRPTVGRAMWIDTLIEASICREWIVNVGRRDALTRIAHLLCELALRLEAAGMADGHHYEIPMTQEQIADCTGLTSVHVNRVLKEMGRHGLIARDKRSLDILDWDSLRQTGDFNARYLHLGGDDAQDLASAV